MAVVRAAAGQQKHFVDINAVAAVREPVENGAKCGVRFFLGDEVVEAIGRGFQRAWTGSRLREEQET